MNPWHQLRLTVLDLETTSADPEEARVVVACIGEVGGGEETCIATLVADPGVEIPAEAAAIHGYTTERARAEGWPAKQVVETVLECINTRPEGSAVVAFNARFDLTILDREARRHGLHPPGEQRPLQVVDPIVIDRHLDRYRKGKRNLQAICDHYNATLDSAHVADADAVSAGRLAWVLGKRGEVVRRVRNAGDGKEKAALVKEWEAVRHDLAALHAAQCRWAAEQAAGLEEHFRKQGKPETVSREWPIVPWRKDAGEA